MLIDDLTALGQKMQESRKNKELTQQELSDLSHVSVKQIANIEKGKMNPSYLILRALAKVLHISLRSKIYCLIFYDGIDNCLTSLSFSDHSIQTF